MRRIILVSLIIVVTFSLGACSGKKISSEQTVSNGEKIHNAKDGVAIIKPQSSSDLESKPEQTESTQLSDEVEVEMMKTTPEAVWEEGIGEDDNFTIVAEQNIKDDGSFATLTIPKIDLSMSVFQTDDTMEAMKKGAAHFKSTSTWNGNIGLSAHNDGVDEAVSFGKIHKLKIGDRIMLTSEMGVINYEVNQIEEILDTDWSYLSRTEENRITLITCIENKSYMRLMVQGVEV